MNPRKLVFVDESGANISMGRSHAWVLKGKEYIEPRPVNWGKNLTMIGAVRLNGWLTMNTMWASANKERFSKWVRKCLAPKLRGGDIVIMDGLSAHKDPRVRQHIEHRRAALILLPPYSPDLNPIEPAWGLIKKRLRAAAPRGPTALRRVARSARYVVKPEHLRNWFAHAGYRRSK